MADTEGLIYDYRLGYVRAGCALQGFDVLGHEDAPEGRIVALGGYTTPEQARNHSSWADRLYGQMGGRAQILNGCTDGYTSAQEMIMLIRDVILFKPRLVICLSGFYNFAYKLGFVKNKEYAQILKTHPFTTPGQIAFYRGITSRFGLGNANIYYGEENNVPAWEYWLEHVDIIHRLCEEFGIRHMTFLQPCAFSGKYRRSQNENAILTESFGLTRTALAELAARFKEQYGLAAEAARSRSYIKDLSSLYDGESGIYTDACHVKHEHADRIAGAIRRYIELEGSGHEA